MENNCKSIDELSAKFSHYVVDLIDFKIGKRLGKGGFSKVYAGLQRETGQLCAIKVLNFKNLKKERFLLYEREIEILAASRNPFLLSFVGFTITAPYCIITEYVPNGCLFHAIRPKPSSKVLSGTEKTIIAFGVACGMKRLHQLGIIHRDLKSLNILLDSNWRPIIADFGLSRYKESSSEYMTSNVGTAHWMAPEIFNGGYYDSKVDVYSYGMLLWEILTGNSPFSGKNSVQIAVAVLKKQERPKFPKKTPKELKDMISSCWAQNPSKRPTFDDILRLFAKHKVKYSDTDDRVIESLVYKIKNHQYHRNRSNEHIKYNDLPPNLQAENPNDIFMIEKDSKRIVFPNPSSPSFQNELIEYANKVTLDNAKLFFDEAKKLLQVNQPPVLVSTVLKALIYLFRNNSTFINFFIRQELHQIPYYQMNTIYTDVSDLYLFLFSYYPTNITLEILSGIQRWASEMPIQYLRLMNLYTCAQPQLPFFFAAISSLVQNCAHLINAGYAIPFLQLMYTITQATDMLQNNREEFRNVINLIFKLNDIKCIHYSLTMMCADTNLAFVLTADQLATYLMTPSINLVAMSLTARLMELVPTTSLIQSLLCNAQEHKIAAFTLLRLCQDPITAIYVATQANSWINVKLPTMKMTAKLVFMIMQFEDVQRTLIQTPRLFDFILSLLDIPNPKYCCSIISIFKKLPISAQHVTFLSNSGFLEKFYSKSLNTNSSDILAQCLSLTDMLGRIAFAPEYLSLLPAIQGLLNDQGWFTYAISVLTTLSIHQEAKNDLRAFVDTISIYKDDPNIGQYANIFLSNLS
ncbi:TKL family protein kinase [Tritrichomonas foetus]|uniref:TKL family protein kinase n=1 Tax=Tritrichomonas foetus TaxID=1144522 RepID=A0A1J4JZ86_9EUKA|nr:TKL family protein kinase [Tritrichomonas foetus]|eukprot:OHT04010.1 TKL family protein kinase [Tritrichomonas foetus]